jgi:hypothetical protein
LKSAIAVAVSARLPGHSFSRPPATTPDGTNKRRSAARSRWRSRFPAIRALAVPHASAASILVGAAVSIHSGQ